MRTRGSKTPYAEDEIGEVPCARCGKPSAYQWNCCAAGNRWMGLCTACDVLLNRTVLRFFRFPDWKALAADYAAKVRADAAIDRHRPRL